MTAPHHVRLQKQVSNAALRLGSSPVTFGAAAAAVAAASLHRAPAALRSLPGFGGSDGQVLGLSGRLVAGGCAFGVGYLAKRYVLAWLRRRALRTLFKYQGWIYGSSSLKAKIWGSVVGLLEGPNPYVMTEFQDCLPKLPVPDLNQTLDKWLEASRVFVDESQYELTRKAVEEFRQNEGPKIQQYLLQRAAKTENWLTDYWLYAAYLSNREPLVCHSNYYTTSVMPEFRVTDPLVRAATVVHLFARYEQVLSNNEIEPVLLQGRVPLCMKGYQYLFNTTRLPGEHVDTIVKFPNNRHVVVIRNGNYYKVDMYAADKNGQMTLLTPTELKTQFQLICEEADEATSDPPVAALTSQNRSIWAKHRQQLMTLNNETLSTIEKAMFILTLDTTSPKDANELVTAVLTGRGNDRWFDKCFNLVTFANAHTGNNIEHSVIDAMVFVTMSEHVMVNEKYVNGDVYREPGEIPRQLQHPTRLQWNVHGMTDIIDKAVEDFTKLASDIDLHVLSGRYSKGFMKKVRLSPDGYFQMAMQLAYHRLHKVTPKTYEPSTSRLYLEGRTETVHPGSRWSVEWVNSMDDSTRSATEKKQLLKSAIQHQNNFRLDATVGRGCDRHLLGLMCASRELGMDMPKIFADDAWRSSFILSTSQTPTRIYELVGKNELNYSMCHGGFGPSSHDGYGVHYYFYGDDMFFVSVSSWHSCPKTSSSRFAEYIDTALADMKQLFSS
jgi:carnitine O-palmitoyltransferase 1